MTLPEVDELMVHLARPDRRAAAERCAAMIEGGMSLTTLVDRGLAPAMERVGRLWESGGWSVADEHLATAAAEAALSAAAAECRPQGARGEVVVACVEGDWHSLPSRMLAEVLVAEGWNVRFLGASQPTHLLVEHLARFRPEVVLLSCAVPMALPELALAVQLIRDLSLPVFVGGRALGAHAHRALVLGADGWAPDARGALQLLQKPERRHDVAPVRQALASYRERQRLTAAWAAAAMERLDTLMPQLATYPTATVERTQADLHHVLDMAAVSLLVQDPTLLDEQCAWLQGVLDARRVPPTALLLGLEALLGAAPNHPLADEVVGSLQTARQRLAGTPAR